MAYNLRLPASLETQARQRSEQLGISLNALLCVALDAYLRGGVQSAGAPPAESIEPACGGFEPDGAACGAFGPAPLESAPSAPRSAPIPKLSKAQRREITRLERLSRKS